MRIRSDGEWFSGGEKQCGLVVRPDGVARFNSKGNNWFPAILRTISGIVKREANLPFAGDWLERLQGDYKPVDGIKHRLAVQLGSFYYTDDRRKGKE